jgi:hypothetical protein
MQSGFARKRPFAVVAECLTPRQGCRHGGRAGAWPVTAESPRRCDIGDAIEVEIDDLPERLGGGAIAQAFGQRLGPGGIFGL